MFWSLVSLLVLALVVRGIVFAVRWFVAWLGRGNAFVSALDSTDGFCQAMRTILAVKRQS